MKMRSLYSAEPARGWLPWGALAPVLALLFVVAPLLSVSVALERFGLVDTRGDPRGLTGLMAFLLLVFIPIGLLVLGWTRFVERRSMASLGLTSDQPLKTFVRGHFIGLATISLVVAAIWVAGAAQANAFGPALHSPSALLSIATLLLCFGVQASVEELVFRGWLLSVIARKFNVSLAVALSSFIFCLLHFSPHQPWLVTLNLVLFALFACCWSIKAGNIWGVMGWHAGWNWLLATGFELPVTGLKVDAPALLVDLSVVGPDYLTGGAQGPEGSIFCGLFFLGAIAYLAARR